MGELTEKQKKFCREWLVDMNGTRAAIRAGYAVKTAAVTACRLMKLPEVQAYRNRLLREECEAQAITRESIALRAKELFERCFAEKEHLSWDSEQKTYVPDGTWCFDTNGAVKALKLMNELVDKMTEGEDDRKTAGGFEGLMEMLGGEE